MKRTGIVRRIDELGRIVIPKEIRKTLRIKEGETLEIYIDEQENILLKKYSSMNHLNDFAEYIADSIHSITKKEVLITDTDKIIATSYNWKKKYKNEPISIEFLKKIEKRESKLEDKKEILKIVEEQEETGTYAFSPIIATGDLVGSILIFSENNIQKSDYELVTITSQILTKYLEE